MSASIEAVSVSFSTKGQIVIPAWLRRQFDIQAGTRASLEATPEGILLKPMTSVVVRRLRGILKPKTKQPTLAKLRSEHKKSEKTLEDLKYARSTGRS